MSEMTLVIANKNYSSWSLRPWLLMKHSEIPFKEIKIPLHQPNSAKDIAWHSPSGRVPVLVADGINVWESLAICEYLAEIYPDKKFWPEDLQARALARSISHEMHAGFMTLRQNMPMNCRSHFPGKGIAPGIEDDINRITQIWNQCHERYGSIGPFLFGHFTIADAMYAPIISRFTTYEVKVDPISKAYMNTILNLPAMKEWYQAAREEKETIPQYDTVSAK